MNRHSYSFSRSILETIETILMNLGYPGTRTFDNVNFQILVVAASTSGVTFKGPATTSEAGMM